MKKQQISKLKVALSIVAIFLMIVLVVSLWIAVFSFGRADDTATEYTLVYVKDGQEVSALMERNADNDTMEEYNVYINLVANTSITFYVTDGIDKYYHNSNGIENIKKSGDYRILFSMEGYESTYKVKIEEKKYNGFYLLGNFNNYQYLEDSIYKFDSRGLVNVISYEITLDITNKIFADCNNKIEFYISNGEVKLDSRQETKAGRYKITFNVPVEGKITTIYVEVEHEYLPAEKVAEIETIDANNNFIYIKGDNLTTETVIDVYPRANYVFIDLYENQYAYNNKIKMSYQDYEISYYVSDPDLYSIKLYKDKVETDGEMKVQSNFVVFSLSSNMGVRLIKYTPPITTALLALIISGSVLVACIAAYVIVAVVNWSKRRKLALSTQEIAENDENSSNNQE